MSDLVRRLKSLSLYCEHLGRDLLDPGMKKRFSDAAGYFAEQADVIGEELSNASAFPSPPDDRT